MNTFTTFIFKKYRKNKEMIAYFKANPGYFEHLIEASLSVDYNKAWRCAMLIGHIARINDSRLQSHVDSFINTLMQIKIDGHQRQILVILDKMKLIEDQEGKLFNYCLTNWENISKIPSTRIRAFWMMEKIAENYPELKKELKYFVTAYYTETLSSGIKHIVLKKYG